MLSGVWGRKVNMKIGKIILSLVHLINTPYATRSNPKPDGIPGTREYVASSSAGAITGTLNWDCDSHKY